MKLYAIVFVVAAVFGFTMFNSAANTIETNTVSVLETRNAAISELIK